MIFEWLRQAFGWALGVVAVLAAVIWCASVRAERPTGGVARDEVARDQADKNKADRGEADRGEADGRVGLAEIPSRPDLDAVWRQIFARPAGGNNAGRAAVGIQNTVTAARVQLGRRLFSDTRLSGDSDRSCASCHNPALGFSDGRKKALGRDGSNLRSHVPALYNLAAAPRLSWDGRATSLEEQAHTPLTAKNELAGEYTVLAERLGRDVEMRNLFERAFPLTASINRETITSALAAFERTIVSPRTRFDEWVEGNDAALNVQEKEGLRLFVGKGGCVSCHGGWRFTDDRLHDIGLKRAVATLRVRSKENSSPRNEFKTPGLRQIRITSPYMHDGSLATLMDVVEHYSDGLSKRPTLAPQVVRDLGLSDTERQALVAFLQTL